jgi:hypothetical protein
MPDNSFDEEIQALLARCAELQKTVAEAHSRSDAATARLVDALRRQVESQRMMMERATKNG